MTACLVQQGSGSLDAAGLGAYVTAGFHLAGLVASFSMGLLSDRVGRARVITVLAGISTLCSLVFGWTIGLPFLLILAIGVVYSFTSLGDSPVLSAGLTEVVTASYLGSAFGLRSLLGFGAAPYRRRLRSCSGLDHPMGWVSHTIQAGMGVCDPWFAGIRRHLVCAIPQKIENKTYFSG
jgi:MFS family permease